jgi:hypothetical protein
VSLWFTVLILAIRDISSQKVRQVVFKVIRAASRIIPKPPSFRRSPARIIEPEVLAST